MELLYIFKSDAAISFRSVLLSDKITFSFDRYVTFFKLLLAYLQSIETRIYAEDLPPLTYNIVSRFA